MRFSYLFVVSFGRSGSTLLQGILNAVPRTLIRGENNNFLYGLFQSWKALDDQRYRHFKGDVRHPWHGYNFFSRRAFEDDIRQIMTRNLLGDENAASHDCLGFKEVRYLDLRDREEFLEFMLRVFPNAAIVLLHRNPDQASDSLWWKKADKGKTMARMQEFIDFARRFAAAHPGNAFEVSLEELTDAERSGVQALCKFCRCRFEPRVIERVLAVQHSVSGPNARPAREDAE